GQALASRREDRLAVAQFLEAGIGASCPVTPFLPFPCDRRQPCVAGGILAAELFERGDTHAELVALAAELSAQCLKLPPRIAGIRQGGEVFVQLRQRSG